jgi:hypothetical protein
MSTPSKSIFRASLFAALLAVATVSPKMHAQDVGMTGQVNVPFAFETANGEHFNAGVYKLQMQNDHTLLIRGTMNGGLVMTTIEDNAQPAKTGKACFHKYGNTYFLSEINVAGQSRRIYLRPSKKEMQVGGSTMPGSVELALLQNAH